MNRILGLLRVAGMAGTFIVSATQTHGVLQFISYVWAVFLTLSLIAQRVRKK